MPARSLSSRILHTAVGSPSLWAPSRYWFRSRQSRRGAACRLLPRRSEKTRAMGSLRDTEQRAGISIAPPSASQLSDIWATTTLRLQPATGTKRSIQVAKQPVMIEDPVEGRGADDPIKCVVKRNLREIGGHKLRSLSELRLQIFASGVAACSAKHQERRPGHRAGRAELGGQTSSAAAGIKQRLIATQLQTRQYFFPPADLRPGKPMVFRRVPLAE